MHPFMYSPTLFVKHGSQTLSSFFSLYQELRFFLSQVWQEQIYKDNKKKVEAILNKMGSHWFFSMPSNLASPEKVLTIYFFSFLNDLHSFFRVITAAKREKKIFTDNNVECRIFLFKWLWIHENHRYWMLIKK